LVTFSNNLFIGKVLISLEIVDSTNDYAKDLLSKSKPLEGTAIIAHTQQQGRGQFGNKWLSEPGKNLTFSIILYPVFLNASQQFSLTQAIALGIKDLLAALVPSTVSIKWPNDIYIDERKVAGILIENTIAGQFLTDAVIGIGLNLNQTIFGDLATATSVSLAAGKEFDKEEVLQNLFHHIEARYLQVKSGHIKELQNEYLQSLYRINEPHNYRAEQDIIEGTILGVNQYGQLQMEIDGAVRTFNNKEVEFL
jgi:BirA family biotin operon repressor/biotin-[acetyl-CoA-carboxylase] ligase